MRVFTYDSAPVGGNDLLYRKKRDSSRTGRLLPAMQQVVTQELAAAQEKLQSRWNREPVGFLGEDGGFVLHVPFFEQPLEFAGFRHRYDSVLLSVQNQYRGHVRPEPVLPAERHSPGDFDHGADAGVFN